MRQVFLLLCLLPPCSLETGWRIECHYDMTVKENLDKCLAPLHTICDTDTMDCAVYELSVMRNLGLFKPFEDFCVHDKSANICTIAVENLFYYNLNPYMHLYCPRMKSETYLCKASIANCKIDKNKVFAGCYLGIDRRAYIKCRDNVDVSCEVLCNRTAHTTYKVQDAFADVCGELLDKTCADKKRCEDLIEFAEFNSSDLNILLGQCANVESNKCVLALQLAIEQNVVVKNYKELNCLKEPSVAKLCGKIASACANKHKGSVGCQSLVEYGRFAKCIDQPTPNDCEVLCDRKNHSLFNYDNTFFDSCGRLLDHVCEEKMKCRTLFDQLQLTSNTTELEKYCTGPNNLGNGCEFLLEILLNGTMTTKRFDNLRCLSGKTPSFCEKILETCREESRKTDGGCVDFMRHTETAIINNTVSFKNYRNLNCLTEKKPQFCEIISRVCQEEDNMSREGCIDFTKPIEIPSTAQPEEEGETEETEEREEYEAESYERAKNVEPSHIFPLLFSIVYLLNI